MKTDPVNGNRTGTGWFLGGLLVVFVLGLLSALGCGNNEDGGGTVLGGGADGRTGTGPSGGNCPPTAFPAETVGCTMTARTPADCATITLPAEFAWGADACHTPYYLQIAGSPPSDWNYISLTINTDPINALAWAEMVYAEHLEGLTTDSGYYHWRVCNAYETGCSASRTFRLK